MYLKKFFYHTLSSIAIIVLTMLVLAWFGFTFRSIMLELDQHWQSDSRHTLERARLNNQLQLSFGYGGLIFHIKQFIQSPTSNQQALIAKKLDETYDSIKLYRAMSGSNQVHAALDDISEIVDFYARQYTLAKQVSASPNLGLDHDLYDKKLFQALHVLHNTTFDAARTRHQILDEEFSTVIEFTQWGWLLIPLLGIVSATIFSLFFRLSKGTSALAQAKRFIDDVIKAAPDALIVVNSQGEIVRNNVQAQNLFGYSAEELDKLNLEKLIPARHRPKHKQHIKQSMQSRKIRALDESEELFALTKQGKEVPIEISLGYTTQENEVLSIAAIRDVSLRKQTEARLRLTSKVMDETSEAIVILDSEHKIVDMNKAYCRFNGCERDGLIDSHPSLLNSEKHDAEFYENLWQQVAEQGYWKGEIWDRHKDGFMTPNLVTISAVQEKSGRVSHYVAHLADITSLKEKEHQLEELAHFDPLTGLANRMLFQDRLRAAMSRANRKKMYCVLLYIDLDGFKQVNDQLGHQVGDQVLIKVATQLNQTLREDDTVARLGGDEFAVVFNELSDKVHIELLVKRVLNALSFSVPAKDGDLPISASIGIAIYPEHSSDISQLTHYADQAMYYSKRHGKNRYCYFNPNVV